MQNLGLAPWLVLPQVWVKTHVSHQYSEFTLYTKMFLFEILEVLLKWNFLTLQENPILLT